MNSHNNLSCFSRALRTQHLKLVRMIKVRHILHQTWQTCNLSECSWRMWSLPLKAFLPRLTKGTDHAPGSGYSQSVAYYCTQGLQEASLDHFSGNTMRVIQSGIESNPESLLNRYLETEQRCKEDCDRNKCGVRETQTPLVLMCELASFQSDGGCMF